MTAESENGQAKTTERERANVARQEAVKVRLRKESAATDTAEEEGARGGGDS